jgi:hypothetical protein
MPILTKLTKLLLKIKQRRRSYQLSGITSVSPEILDEYIIEIEDILSEDRTKKVKRKVKKLEKIMNP